MPGRDSKTFPGIINKYASASSGGWETITFCFRQKVCIQKKKVRIDIHRIRLHI